MKKEVLFPQRKSSHWINGGERKTRRFFFFFCSIWDFIWNSKRKRHDMSISCNCHFYSMSTDTFEASVAIFHQLNLQESIFGDFIHSHRQRKGEDEDEGEGKGEEKGKFPLSRVTQFTCRDATNYWRFFSIRFCRLSSVSQLSICILSQSS